MEVPIVTRNTTEFLHREDGLRPQPLKYGGWDIGQYKGLAAWTFFSMEPASDTAEALYGNFISVWQSTRPLRLVDITSSKSRLALQNALKQLGKSVTIKELSFKTQFNSGHTSNHTFHDLLLPYLREFRYDGTINYGTAVGFELPEVCVMKSLMTSKTINPLGKIVMRKNWLTNANAIYTYKCTLKQVQKKLMTDNEVRTAANHTELTLGLEYVMQTAPFPMYKPKNKSAQILIQWVQMFLLGLETETQTKTEKSNMWRDEVIHVRQLNTKAKGELQDIQRQQLSQDRAVKKMIAQNEYVLQQLDDFGDKMGGPFKTILQQLLQQMSFVLPSSTPVTGSNATDTVELLSSSSDSDSDSESERDHRPARNADYGAVAKRELKFGK
jgi:hypothetical protein